MINLHPLDESQQKIFAEAAGNRLVEVLLQFQRQIEPAEDRQGRAAAWQFPVRMTRPANVPASSW